MVAVIGQVDARTQYAATKVINRGNVNGVPPRCDSERRTAADDSLRVFLETYFPGVFPLDWSPDHLDLIDQVEHRITEGGLKAIAYPRGSGKTSILLRAALWAILTGRRRFVCMIACNDEMANKNLLDAIKSEINNNELLSEDYGREIYCLQHLGGQARRCQSQNYNGRETGVEYSVDRICFGCIPDCVTSGAVISARGINSGNIRGQNVTLPTGENIRVDLVLVDDPQTKSSAASAAQCRKRHETMMGDVLGCAGPGVKISGFCACTVIYQDDLADRLLDRRMSKEWNGSRVSMIKKWPTWMDGWDQYDGIRAREFSEGTDHTESRRFLVANFDRLHEGAEVYWEARKAESDLSALHHAMDLFYRDQGVFAAEFQNAPMRGAERPPFDINALYVAQRITGLPRAHAPIETDKITAFVDTQRELLYYVICAWTNRGGCYVIDYGAAPDQGRHYWQKSNVRHTLQSHWGDDLETALRGGLNWLLDAILTNTYTTEDGSELQVDRLAIDARWGESTEIIRRVVRELPRTLKSRVHPSMGMYVGANSRSWQKLKVDRKKDREGTHAKLQPPTNGTGNRELLYDTNFWKSFAADRLCCGKEATKSILLFNAEPHEHRMFGEHCAYEDPERVVGKANNEVVEWKQNRLGGTIENDLWDCLVGNCALASVIGVKNFEGLRTRNHSAAARALNKVLKARGLK